MNNPDVNKHVRGESIFIDDISLPAETLHCAVLDSAFAHAGLVSINTNRAEKMNGVIAVLTSKDIPGENQIGGIIQDETLLAVDEVKYIGEPLAIVLADSITNARKAAAYIDVEYKKLPVITDAREACKNGSLIQQPTIFESGDIDKAWGECDFVYEGRVETGGQEHLYLETQCAVAYPKEEDKLLVLSSTQHPTAVQRAISRVLGIPMSNIEVDVLRLGGAFGGKEDQATHWAVLSALGAHITRKPVKLVLPRYQDIRVTGKRHPYSSDYKIGLKKNGKIIAFEVIYYQNAGACADLSPAVLERTLFHVTNSYFIPNVRATGISCKTNLVPNTAFRGFGGPQAMFVVESALHDAAEKSGISYQTIQKSNLIKDGELFHYGQTCENSNALKCWEEAERLYDFIQIKKNVDEFNQKNKLVKKGFSIMPVCFGISFTSSFLNQASALVHIYTDGSIGVSTAAVEMGQGVNTKIKTIVAEKFSVSSDRIKIESTNTTRIANSSATAASSGADLNGNAVLLSCSNILERLKKSAAEELVTEDKSEIEFADEFVFVNGKKTELTWTKLVQKSYMKRINLSSHSFYATPEIYFDRTINKGRPFAYHVYGTALIVVELDCILGRYKLDTVKIVHDFGKSLHPKVDIGQVEGGLLQGIGWMTMEEIIYSQEGRLLSNSLSTYKVPDIYFTPQNIEVNFLEESINKFGPFNSKAIGEPPLMYGIGVYFAIRNAMKAYKKNLVMDYSAPLTPEKVLMNLFM
ncbi:MAG: molybdopterin-dependent oxidoreductase [Melioribacteraceae bacterium]|nr:molybdopterin-dependent oxidoreductase [Melioribacteraceae bacterium]